MLRLVEILGLFAAGGIIYLMLQHHAGKHISLGMLDLCAVLTLIAATIALVHTVIVEDMIGAVRTVGSYGGALAAESLLSWGGQDPVTRVGNAVRAIAPYATREQMTSLIAMVTSTGAWGLIENLYDANLTNTIVQVPPYGGSAQGIVWDSHRASGYGRVIDKLVSTRNTQAPVVDIDVMLEAARADQVAHAL